MALTHPQPGASTPGAFRNARKPARRAIVAAALFDVLVGEPPAALHPVIAMGAIPNAMLRRFPTGQPVIDAVAGACVTASVTTVAAGAGALAGMAGARLPELQGVFLGTLGAWRGLDEAGAAMAERLRAGHIDAARDRLSGLCSRDATSLHSEALASATIESLAENASDSIVAPLFWYVCAGLGGAAFYRAANTLDATIGYRGELEWFGKPAARLDDLLNLAPARLCAALIAAVSGRPSEVWKTTMNEAGRTESPNAGWPMAAMSAALRVRLHKDGHHCLGEGHAPPDAEAIQRARRILRRSSMLAVALAWLSAC